MFPMGYYDYGYGLGYGMSQMVPPPAVVNHQADENVYVAHHESNDGATIALLSFAAIGSLAGLLIARKANKTTKLIDAVTHDLRETAKKGADEILESGKKAAEEAARKIESDARVVAGGIKDEARGMRKAAAEDVKTAEGLKLHWEGKVHELVELDAKREAEIADLKGRIAELSKRATVSSGGTRQKASRTSSRVDTITRGRFPESAAVETIIVKGGDAQAIEAAANAAKEALPKAGSLIEEGQALVNAGKFEEALSKNLDSIRIYEDNLTYYGHLDGYHIEDYSSSLNNAGVCCMEIPNRMDEAIQYLEKSIAVATKKPNQLALKNLADCHRNLNNENELVKCLKALSDIDDVPAMVELGGIKEAQAQKIMNKTGATAADVAANSTKSTELYKEAAESYKKAADKGNVDAKAKLARLYDHGPKELKNDVKAAKLYKEAIADCVQMVEDGKGDANVVATLKVLNIELGSLRGFSQNPEVAKLFADDEGFAILRVKAECIARNGSLKADDVLPDLDIQLPPDKSHKTLPGVDGDSAAPTGQFHKPGADGAAPSRPVLTPDQDQLALDATAYSEPRVANTGIPAAAPSPAAKAPANTPANAPAPALAPVGADASKGNDLQNPPKPPSLSDVAAKLQELKQRFIPHSAGAKPSANKPAPRGFFGRLAAMADQVQRGEVTPESLSRDVKAKFAAWGAQAKAPASVKPGEVVASKAAATSKDAADAFTPSAAKGEGAVNGANHTAEGLNPESAARAAEQPNPVMAGEEAANGAFKVADADLQELVIKSEDLKTIPPETEVASDVAASAQAPIAEINPNRTPSGDMQLHIDASKVENPNPVGNNTLVEPLDGHSTIVKEPSDDLVGQTIPRDPEAGAKLFDHITPDAAGQTPTPVSGNMFETAAGKAEAVVSSGTGAVDQEAQTIVPRTLPLDSEAASQVARTAESAAPQASQATGKAPEPGVSPNLTGKVGNDAPTAVPATEAVHVAEEAVTVNGELTTDAIRCFEEGRNDEGFAKLEHAINMGDAGAREYKLGMFDAYFDSTTVDADAKRAYFPAFLDFLLDSAQNGSAELKQSLIKPLEKTYETKKINDIDIPKELHSILEQALAAVKGIKEG